MRARFLATLAGIAILIGISRANADTAIYSSIPDLSAFSWNNAYCSDCVPRRRMNL